MPRMRKYGESKTTRFMMATVPHVTSGSGLRKFQANGFLLDRVYKDYEEAGRRSLESRARNGRYHRIFARHLTSNIHNDTQISFERFNKHN